MSTLCIKRSPDKMGITYQKKVNVSKDLNSP